jgi:hypothetical protein
MATSSSYFILFLRKFTILKTYIYRRIVLGEDYINIIDRDNIKSDYLKCMRLWIYILMFYFFRHKMFFVVKYFQRNNF